MRIRHSEPGTLGGLRRPHTVCRRSLCTVERSRSQEATPDGGRFIPAPEPESSPFEHGIQNEFGALGTVDSDFRSLMSEHRGWYTRAVEKRHQRRGMDTAIASNALTPKIPLKAFSAYRNTPIVALSHVLNLIQY